MLAQRASYKMFVHGGSSAALLLYQSQKFYSVTADPSRCYESYNEVKLNGFVSFKWDKCCGGASSH